MKMNNNDLPRKIILQTRLEEHVILDLAEETDWYDEICDEWKKDKEIVLMALKLVYMYGTVSGDLLKKISDKDDLDGLYDDYMRIVEKKENLSNNDNLMTFSEACEKMMDERAVIKRNTPRDDRCYIYDEEENRIISGVWDDERHEILINLPIREYQFEPKDRAARDWVVVDN